MPVYHSSYLETEKDFKVVGNLALLPLKTKTRGPAPPFNATEALQEDIVDEALSLFRANCFFRNFEIQGASDRVLIYCLLFITECLQKISAGIKGDNYPAANDSLKQLTALAMANFAIPGDASFPLNAMYDKPKDRNDLDTMRSYLQQLRQEIAVRLVEKIYSASYTDTEGGKRPSKWWVCFAKRKFMNLQL